ncbi:PAS domain-containing sensor histidine kinase [Pedobacter psychrodurus]|uniref:histidine kinase n=1 Tax=Pedobacter psychrodurus TaxID=2530456 RepID=A0A4R0Q157_9SPHI|nr:PAS domain-containing sensor histidine kinase [Pedobacter psychrodurus]TCD28706.1 PAS domain-containing sensor histidine kinase [Pedobacter psychrodurus]
MQSTNSIKIDDYQNSTENLCQGKYSAVTAVLNVQSGNLQFYESNGKLLEFPIHKENFTWMEIAGEDISITFLEELHRLRDILKIFSKQNTLISNGKVPNRLDVVPHFNNLEIRFLLQIRDSAENVERCVGSEIQHNPAHIFIEQSEPELSPLREAIHNVTDDQDPVQGKLQSSYKGFSRECRGLQNLIGEVEMSREELERKNEGLVDANNKLQNSLEELNMSRKLSDATIAVLHEPLLVLDKELIILSANQAFYKTFKIAETQVIGKKLYELQNGGWNIPGLAHKFTRIQDLDESVIETEIAFDFPSLGERIIKFNMQPVNKTNGEQLILLALDDITVSKNNIQEQKLILEQLQVQISEKIKLECQKNDLICMISHELKTPVTIIKGCTQALMHKFNKNGNLEAVSFLCKMNNQVNKLSHLIGDLLDASEVTAGQLKYNMDTFELNELIEEISDEFKQTSDSHTILLNLGEKVRIFGDRIRIGQVITNLLSNAIKYSPKASRVTLRTLVNGKKASISVEDTGIGISIQSQKNIFDKFYRANGVVNGKYSGLGLGLYIVSQIVKEHRGGISVSSREQEGSVFTIDLPFS